MGLKKKGMTLERLDTNKGYSPDNCAWVTMRDNLNNRRNTVRIKDVPVTILSDKIGVKADTLRKRLRYGVQEDKLCLPRVNAPKEALHGTRLRYERDGCRCSACKDYNAERARQFRLKKKQNQPEKI